MKYVAEIRCSQLAGSRIKSHTLHRNPTQGYTYDCAVFSSMFGPRNLPHGGHSGETWKGRKQKTLVVIGSPSTPQLGSAWPPKCRPFFFCIRSRESTVMPSQEKAPQKSNKEYSPSGSRARYTNCYSAPRRRRSNSQCARRPPPQLAEARRSSARARALVPDIWYRVKLNQTARLPYPGIRSIFANSHS